MEPAEREAKLAELDRLRAEAAAIEDELKDFVPHWQATDCYTLTLFIVQAQQDASWQTTTYTATYRALQRADLNAALDQAGFTDLRWHMPQDTGYHQPIVMARG